jgi:hypothetical protein
VDLDQIDRRLMNYYIDRWRANDRAVRKLLQTTELWCWGPVAAPHCCCCGRTSPVPAGRRFEYSRILFRGEKIRLESNTTQKPSDPRGCGPIGQPNPRRSISARLAGHS